MSVLYEAPDVKFVGRHPFLVWLGDDCCYVLQALTQTFNWISLMMTAESCCSLEDFSVEDYLELRVVYGAMHGEVFIEYGVSESITTDFAVPFRDVNIRSCKSYGGNVTISFWDDGFYDKYKVYIRDNNSWMLIGETEDPQITISYAFHDCDFYAEGYVETQDGLVLSGMSFSQPLALIPSEYFVSDDIDLTVVCPVYNAEYFISRAIDSLLLSSLKVHILCIDDGSTDNSPDILDWYAENYPNVKVVHQKNANRSITRNNGLKLVNTPYTAFIDADDLVHPYMYEKLYKYLRDNDLDICVCQTVARDALGQKEIIFKDGFENLIYTYEDYIKSKVSFKKSLFYCVVWNHIAKTEAAASVLFPDDDYPNQLLPYEDNAYVTGLYSWTDKIGYVADAYYIYERRQRKTTGTVSTDTYSKKYGGYNAHDILIWAWEYGIEHSDDTYRDLTVYSCVYDAIREVVLNKYPDSILAKYRRFIDKYDVENNQYIKDNEVLSKNISVFKFKTKALVSGITGK